MTDLLYDLPESMICAIGEDGELTDETESALADLQIDQHERLTSYIRWHKSIIARKHAIKDEIESLKAKLASAERDAEFVEAMLQKTMVAANLKKFTNGVHRVTRCNKPPHVEVKSWVPDMSDPLMTPFVRVVPEQKEVNKAAVLAAWRAKQFIPAGLSVVEGEERLSIS